MKFAGLLAGHNQQKLRGDLDENGFSVWYLKDGALDAVDAINDPAAFMVSKKLLTENITPALEQIEDKSFDLKSLLKK